jgi:hypothetical protein
VGALETKKQPVFLGNTLGRCASADTEGNSNAAQLELSVSKGESPRISGSPGQTKKLRYKTSPTTWLSQVNDKWDRVLYQAGTDRKINTVPDKAKALLTNGVDLERMARERNWISFASLAEAWGM